MKTLARIYEREDGCLSIVYPAWNDRWSPFHQTGEELRAAYAAADAAGKLQLEAQNLDWLAMYPFNPFTVTREEFYEWAVTRGVPTWWGSRGDVDQAALPSDRSFRNCWRLNGDTIHVDPSLETLERWKRIRAERDQRLKDSDVLMMRKIEAGASTTALASYRQALRDIPQVQKDPKAIVWPELPS